VKTDEKKEGKLESSHPRKKVSEQKNIRETLISYCHFHKGRYRNSFSLLDLAIGKQQVDLHKLIENEAFGHLRCHSHDLWCYLRSLQPHVRIFIFKST